MALLLILALLMISDSRLASGECVSERDQVLSVTPVHPEHIAVLKDICLLKDQYKTVLLQPASPQNIREEKDVHLFVSASSCSAVQETLQRHNITYHVLLNNTKELIKLQTNTVARSRGRSSFYETYHSLEEIYEWINVTAQNYPDMVEVILLGASFENRPIYVLKLFGKNRGDKKAIWMDCGIHAREWISHAFCLWFVHHALTNYQYNQNISHILDNRDVYVLPVVNPDGYKFTWNTTDSAENRLWRKNRSTSKHNSCIGVDLNRNFDANWCTEGASADPCSDIYCGRAPASEPETRAVADFLLRHREAVDVYFTMHAYSQMLLFPYSYTLERAPNHAQLYKLVEEVAERIKEYSGNTYTYGAGATTIYVAPGGSDDWAFDQGVRYSFTFELQDDGHYGFLLPPSRIAKACEEALIAVETIALGVIETTLTHQNTSGNIF